MRRRQVGLLIGHEGPLDDAFPSKVFNVALVVEEKIIVYDFRDVLSGFAMLVGVTYCLNLEYPRTMRYSFEFLQKVVLSIQPDQCSARVHGLRKKLLRYRLWTSRPLSSILGGSSYGLFQCFSPKHCSFFPLACLVQCRSRASYVLLSV